MSDLINFPIKKINRPKNKTPEEALQYVIDHLHDGSTRATKLVVAWAYEDDEQVEYRFLSGGTDSDISSIGLLEVAKTMVLED